MYGEVDDGEVFITWLRSPRTPIQPTNWGFMCCVAYTQLDANCVHAHGAVGFAPAFCIGDKSIRYTAANFVANQYSGIHS